MIELNSSIVAEGIDGKERLDVFLANETGWTRSQIKLQIDNGKVLVNEKTQKAGFLVKNDDKIVLSFSKDVFDTKAVMTMDENELREKLVMYKVALQPNKQPIIWKNI